MSRTMGAMAIILIISFLFCVSPAAHAEKVTIQLDKSLFGIASNSKVEAHLKYLEVDDDRAGNTYTTTPLDRVKWYRLYYYYDNHGDSTATGNLKLVFIDQEGNEYKPDDGTYTGETVAPNTMSSTNFVELPIPKDSRIVTIRVIQAFEHTDFDVPEAGSATATDTATATATATATVAPTTTPSGTAAATSNGNGNCLPLLPFAILSAIGIAGIAAGKGRAK